MANGLLTPLQLTAGSALLTNTGIRVAPAAINSYKNYYLISALQNAINYYLIQSWSTPSTLSQMLIIGNSVCGALGNSIPAGAPTPRPITGPVNTGFSGLIYNTGALYLGNGDVGKFAQAFNQARGYISSTNTFINSAANAQTYLGPTFTSMDALTTNNLSAMNSDFGKFGVDLGNQGQLTNFSNLNDYGTPAALLRQLANLAGISGGTLPSVRAQLSLVGVTDANIRTLIVGNRNEDVIAFDRLQQLAYQAMTKVVGADLQEVLSILDVTTPNINTMADLLNQKMIFPNSWPTLTVPTTSGNTPVYLPDGGVNMNLATTVASYLPTASGCEELGKVLPPDQAVASKSVQTSFQQITGIGDTTLPALAQTVLGQSPNVWDVNSFYLANTTVSDGNTLPTYYRAQQNVNPGVNLTDTAYWQPTSLGGLSTMAGLPAIQAQTQALPTSAATYYSNLATGTGPDGTITIGDVFGAAASYGYTSNFATVLNIFSVLQSSGALDDLYDIYVSMSSATNDSQMLSLISQANAAIGVINSNNTALVSNINTAWSAMATKLHIEYVYQTSVGISWDDLPANNRTSVFGLVQSIAQFGLEVDVGGPAWFLDQIADTETLGGQALVGAMREARNNLRLNAAQLGMNTKPESDPSIVPAPVVTPVY